MKIKTCRKLFQEIPIINTIKRRFAMEIYGMFLMNP